MLAFAVYTFFSYSALYTVNISYEFKNVSGTQTIEASTDGSSDFKITKLENTDSASAFLDTTGQKAVGEVAKGQISVFNATSEIKVIKKGTTITCISSACKGLVYISNTDLNLGPGSSVNDYPITASDIGENYNLATNAGRFKVGNYNSGTEIISSNISPISGGTQKTFVKIASQADADAVEKKALDDLKNIILTNIRTNSENNSKYIISDSSFQIKKISSQTDPVGTEEETINTTVQAKGTVDAFPKAQIENVIKDLKSSIIPDGFHLDEDYFHSDTKVISSTPGKITLEVSVNAVARPNLNTDEIKQSIFGKSIPDAEKYLSSIPNTKSYSASYSPSTMPGFLRHVPSDPNRVQIQYIALDPST